MGSEGLCVASRYRLLALLGRGGHGEVWAAEDLLLGGEVALKLLHDRPGEPPHVRREIATLRSLRLPGVVRLLDEGMDGERPFLVMERIYGAAFPGRGLPRPCPFSAIRERTIEIADVLARIHAAGVVHRDLKPENILVDDAGRAFLVDFGLSHRAPLGFDAAEGALLGTPLHAAPEQIRGEPVGPFTDLYALGVILYEALSGRLPHEARDFQELVELRLHERPAPLAAVAPGVPPDIAAVVDALLAIEPEDRPRSAEDLSRALRGRPKRGGDKPFLPRLGSDAAARRVFDAVCHGQSIDVVGPPGSGRTHCLEDVAERLSLRNVPVLRAAPSERPFASIAAMTGSLDSLEGSLAEVVVEVESRLARILAEGAVFFVDDAERIDRFSFAALERCRARGAVVRVLSRPAGEAIESISPAPLEIADLLPLFAGPTRLFHLATDAAEILSSRTRGLPARIVLELSAWERAGLARRSGELFVVDREGLDRLSVELDERAAPPVECRVEALPRDESRDCFSGFPWPSPTRAPRSSRRRWASPSGASRRRSRRSRGGGSFAF